MLAKGVVPKDDWAGESGHWYCATTGEPRYTIKGANGVTRNTTLRDARKHNLVPSVSTILQLEAKPQLTKWLVTQGMMACLTLPRIPGESDQDFMARALTDSKQQTIAAADRGSYLHGLLENAIRDTGDGTPMGLSVEDMSYICPVIFWIRDNFSGYTWSVERSFSCSIGYGGKLDLTGTHPTKPPAVLDYKCKDFDDPKKPLAYDNHVTQLAAYAFGLGYENARCVNLFISSTVPGLIVPHEWSQDSILQGRRAFLALLELWKARKHIA